MKILSDTPVTLNSVFRNGQWDGLVPFPNIFVLRYDHGLVRAFESTSFIVTFIGSPGAPSAGCSGLLQLFKRERGWPCRIPSAPAGPYGVDYAGPAETLSFNVVSTRSRCRGEYLTRGDVQGEPKTFFERAETPIDERTASDPHCEARGVGSVVTSGREVSCSFLYDIYEVHWQTNESSVRLAQLSMFKSSR